MQKYIDKTKILIEALPYIKCFSGKTVVIKYGGSAMLNDELKKSVLQDIVLMKLVGMSPVIVHGGGPEINKMLKQINKQSEFINGLRVTDEETMEIVEMVLSGKVNKDIVTNIQTQGFNAVGISGKDGNILKAKKKLIDGQDAGFIGEIVEVNANLIKILIQNDFIPVIAPTGMGEDGNTYNINADYAASAIAGALEAEKLVFLTDISGVLRDVNDNESIISSITVSEAKKLIQDGTISGGMIPKVDCCIEGVEKGVKTVHILDGRVEHSLLLEIFTDTGIGTMINKN
ncbi:MAG: acetylglutamate kinase [Candidatus Melainabacteria bacterium GWA2_34_9]|nr:MAG: acetylglutamate kinase [Candidatus Melainabacteria bacterium GWA2_34_9]